MTLVRRVFDTPVGPMMALATDAALCALEFWKPGRMTRLDARLRRWFPPCEVADGDNHVIAHTSEWLDHYFAPSTSSGQAGSPAADPPLDMRGAPFELRVWAALRLIPPGRTVSYGEIARQIGAPGSSRAVGMANGANPIAIIVPCHRVIGSNGTLTGYGGGLDRKAWLLDHERGQLPLAIFQEAPQATKRRSTVTDL
jgi:methylated-DNA-[protein]-cysteine S-methyltransferase